MQRALRRREHVVERCQLQDLIGSILERLGQAPLQSRRQLVQEEARVVVDELVAHLAQHRVAVEQVLHVELTLLDLDLDGEPLDAHVLLAVPVVPLAVQLDTCAGVFCVERGSVGEGCKLSEA